MAKQDVLDAINATIVSNGIKGITAQSLNNILTMMTENAGEGGGGGSGDGALRIMVPDTMTGIHEEFIYAGEFSPAIWEQIKVELANSGMPMDISAWDVAFSACFAHNAEVYQSLLKKIESHEGTFAILDQSLSMAVSYKMMIESEAPGAVEKVDVSLGQLALCVGIHMHPAEGYEEMFGPQAEPMIMVTPLYGQPDDMESYPPELMMGIMPDGSIMFDASPSTSTVYQFYIPESSDVSLTSEQKSLNRSFKSYGQYSNFSWDNVNIYFVSSSGYSMFDRVNFVSYNRDSDSPYYCYFKDLELKKAVLASDGSVSVETLGILTTPTE